MIEYIHSTAMNSTMLTPMHGTECKGLKKILGLVVGVAASIAVPFLAPVIGGALGGGFFASIAGQALIGGGIGALGGAAGAALSGGDILRGALLGGAGGALAGGGGAFFQGAGLTTAAPVTPTAGIPTIDPLTGFENANVPLAGAAASGAAGAGLTTTGALASPESAAAALATPVGSTAAAAPAAPGILAGTSTGFKTAAVQTLLNGGTQLLQTLQPSQQAEIFAQMQKEMEITKQQDMAAYNAQKKIFDEYYNFAKSINPQFYAELERANAQQRLSSSWADIERGLRTGGASQNEIAAARRKHEIEGSTGLTTAYTGGLTRGMGAQGQALTTAAGLYPKTPTNYLENLKGMYNLAGDREADNAAGIAGLVAPWKVYAQNKIEGMPNTRPNPLYS